MTLEFPPPIAEQEINTLKVICNNSKNGCDWVGELQLLDDHHAACGYTLLRCTNKCMNNITEVYLLRCDLDFHLRIVCPNRQFQCPYCKAMGKYCNIETTHLVKATCPNNGCDVEVPRCHLSNHRSTCQYEKVPCKYARIGCKEKPFRNGLKEHENDDKFHLHLAIETVNEQQKEMEKQQKKINKQSEEINEQKEEINKQQEEVKVISEKVRAGQAGPCVVKMPEFSRYKSSKREWYSPPFYTHPGGYKMCVRVDANGDGKGVGTHVSVFAYLMKGKNDDNLPWPFTGEVTVTLLNQLADRNHYTLTSLFQQDDGIGRRVVNDEIAATGYGWHKFISHNQLGYYAAKICQYLKNDSLYFQIDVETHEPVKHWLISSV